LTTAINRQITLMKKVKNVMPVPTYHVHVIDKMAFCVRIAQDFGDMQRIFR